MAVTAPVMLCLWAWGTAYLIRHDPQLAGRLRYSLAGHNRAVHKGLLPPWKALGAAVPRYLRRSYHPSQEGSLRRAVDYLARSPAARGALVASRVPGRTEDVGSVDGVPRAEDPGDTGTAGRAASA
jgi:predicted metal-dependent hydrolase